MEAVLTIRRGVSSAPGGHLGGGGYNIGGHLGGGGYNIGGSSRGGYNIGGSSKGGGGLEHWGVI